MNSAARWSLVFAVVVLGLAYAVWPRDEVRMVPSERATSTTIPAQVQQGDTEGAVARIREKAALEPCRRSTEPSSGVLSAVVLECLSDGSQVDLGRVVAGKPAVLNVWAYWCAPCIKELPAMQEFAARAGDAVTVLTIHNDPGMSLGLQRLTDLGVHLSGVQDSRGSIAAALGLPNVKPVTVLLRADGSVAKILPVPFVSADDIAGEVRRYLGVSA